MAIYKQDAITINGVTHGERVDGQDEIRMPYRIAASITNSGYTYTFVGMDKGEAVYRRGEAASKPVEPVKPAPAVETTTEATQTLTELPMGAILDAQFVGRYMTVNNIRYRLYQPVSKMNGKYVYVHVMTPNSWTVT